MKISDKAISKIKLSLNNNPGKLPRVVLKKGGCAGNMLVLVLEEPDKSDSFVESGELKFAISDDAQRFVNDIVIDVKPGLCEEVVVRLEHAKTCRCGKSFRL